MTGTNITTMSPGSIIVIPLGDKIDWSSLTIAPSDTSFGNLISFNFLPTIEEISMLQKK